MLVKLTDKKTQNFLKPKCAAAISRPTKFATRYDSTWGQGTADCVSNFMVGYKRLALAVYHGGSLHAGNNSVYTVINL